MIKIDGYCPFGCGQTLIADFVPRQGYRLHLSCSNPKCPDRDFVNDLFAEPIPKHILRITNGIWSLVHPLCERHHHALLGCVIPEMLDDWMIEQPDGLYRIENEGDSLTCVALTALEAST